MKKQLFLIGGFFILSLGLQAQVKAKAISYAVDIDLIKFNPEAAGELAQKSCTYEVDAYYTDQKVRTVVRTILQPMEITLRQRVYDINTKDEFNIDHENKFILHKKDQSFKMTSTGNKKTIVGHECKEYAFKDYRNIQFSVWVDEKMPKNICPTGNFSLKGTALEVTASNGVHYVATDFAEGQLDPSFFELPKEYEQEVVLPPGSDKKSK